MCNPPLFKWRHFESDIIVLCVRPRRHLLSASAYRQEMRNRFASWAEITSTERAA